MYRQGELGQLYEIKSRLEEIETLNKAIAKKKEAIEAEKKQAENISVDEPDTGHVSRERMRIDSEKEARNKKIFISLVVVTICVFVAFAVVTMVMAYNYYAPVCKNLSETESVSIGFLFKVDADIPVETLKCYLGMCILPMYICLCGLTIFCLYIKEQ